MKNNITVKNYQSKLDVLETQRMIKILKNNFETVLAKELDLVRVSAPLFVDPKTGLNDNLSGKEDPVSFCLNNGKRLEIIQSLAKWKRNALKEYKLKGLYTDMNAIRPNEETDNIHSIYVDQWDWEKIIQKDDRNIEYLKTVVDKIYEAFKETDKLVSSIHPFLNHNLPENVTYITSQELLDLYPNLSGKQREDAIVKKYKVVFVIGIGCKLSDGSIHDSRAADYDDWKYNGDLLVYNEVLDNALEISSMGIRVNKESLLEQIKIKNEEFKLEYKYHKDIINDQLPLTIGGGIGQSRLCLYFLNKAHIGEVQSSYWPEDEIELFKKNNIILL